MHKTPQYNCLYPDGVMQKTGAKWRTQYFTVPLSAFKVNFLGTIFVLKDLGTLKGNLAC